MPDVWNGNYGQYAPQSALMSPFFGASGISGGLESQGVGPFGAAQPNGNVGWTRIASPYGYSQANPLTQQYGQQQHGPQQPFVQLQIAEQQHLAAKQQQIAA